MNDPNSTVEQLKPLARIYSDKDQRLYFSKWDSDPLSCTIASRDFEGYSRRDAAQCAANPKREPRPYLCYSHKILISTLKQTALDYNTLSTRWKCTLPPLRLLQFDPLSVVHRLEQEAAAGNLPLITMNLRLHCRASTETASDKAIEVANCHTDSHDHILNTLTGQKLDCGMRPINAWQNSYVRRGLQEQTKNGSVSKNKEDGYQDVTSTGTVYRPLEKRHRVEGCKFWHFVRSGTGHGGALVWTFDDHDFTDVQIDIIDGIFKDYSELLNKKFVGRIPFDFTAPSGEKMTFRLRQKDEQFNGNVYTKRDYYYDGCVGVGVDLEPGVISTFHGSRLQGIRGDYDVRE